MMLEVERVAVVEVDGGGWDGYGDGFGGDLESAFSSGRILSTTSYEPAKLPTDTTGPLTALSSGLILIPSPRTEFSS